LEETNDKTPDEMPQSKGLSISSGSQLFDHSLLHEYIW